MTTEQVLELLRTYESRNVTSIAADGSWPIVWTRACGVYVQDARGRRYLDLTGGFGVAAAGHANPRVVRAAQRQMARLLHAMGDVHPHPLKAQLARELSRITFERWSGAGHAGSQRNARIGRASSATGVTGKAVFCNSGFEAVEVALKTALLATGKPGVLAFEGAYHGLGYGALAVTHREYFRRPFRAQLGRFAHFLPFPGADSRGNDCNEWRGAFLDAAARLFERVPIGAVLVEPVQGRGGIRIPPRGFLSLLRRFCDAHGALLMVDEIYTGFGRTGYWFACERDGVVPDVVCLGKALAGGFPISACVGRAELMDAAWPESHGEALHTSTFAGHPVGCAMALAQIAELRRGRLPERARRLGELLLGWLRRLRAPRGRLELSARGLGLMAGVELRRADGAPAGEEAFRIVKAMLRRGFILLSEGEHGNVLSFTPPLTIRATELRRAVAALQDALAEEGHA